MKRAPSRPFSRWVIVAALLGSLGVTLGAFGAHALPGWLQQLGYEGEAAARRLATFETAVRYQLFTAIALLALASLIRDGDSRAWRAAAWLLTVGVGIFSGLCYALAIAGPELRWLGAIVPIGGVMMIAGWVAIGIGAFQKRSSND